METIQYIATTQIIINQCLTMPIKAQRLHDIILNSAVLIEITIINDKQNNEPLQRGLC